MRKSIIRLMNKAMTSKNRLRSRYNISHERIIEQREAEYLERRIPRVLMQDIISFLEREELIGKFITNFNDPLSREEKYEAEMFLYTREELQELIQEAYDSGMLDANGFN